MVLTAELRTELMTELTELKVALGVKVAVGSLGNKSWTESAIMIAVGMGEFGW